MTSEMIHMTEDQLSRVRKLIRKMCCNYDEGNCLLFDWPECSICPQWITYSLLCKWFRDAVLPNDRRLESELYGTRPAGYCKNCGKPLFRKAKNQKYCNRCSALVRREKEAKRQRERYRNLRILG